MRANLARPHVDRKSGSCFRRIHSIDILASLKHSFVLSVQRYAQCVTRPMRIRLCAGSGHIQHCAPTACLKLCIPRILQVSNYSIDPVIQDASTHEGVKTSRSRKQSSIIDEIAGPQVHNSHLTSPHSPGLPGAPG